MAGETVIVKVRIHLPLRTVSETNAREHWRVKANRARMQRGLAKNACFGNGVDGIASAAKWNREKLIVTMIRIGKRYLDNDNLAASFKHVRDGIADACGVDDGSDFYEWRYEQAKDSQYAIEVRITRG